mgnify:CR=1 FL=1
MYRNCKPINPDGNSSIYQTFLSGWLFANSGDPGHDLRFPQNIVLDVRNFIRILVLITSDLIAIASGWYVVNSNYIQSFLLSSESINSDINLLFPSVLLIGISFLSLCQAYRRGIKSRNAINSSKAITLTYLALFPIAWQLYGKGSLFQLFWAWSIAIILIHIFRFAIFQGLLYLRQKYFPCKIKVMVI